MLSPEKKSVKKKVYYVPSRYKQAAEKVAQASSCREKTTFLKTRSQEQSESSNYSSDSSKLTVSEGGHSEMTSTPSTSKGALTMPPLDASAVSTISGHLPVPHLKESIGPLPSKSVKRNIKKSKYQNKSPISHRPVTSRRKKIFSNPDALKTNEEVVDLMYARYVQCAFLDYRTKKALEERSSHVLEKIAKLFCVVLLHLDELKVEQAEAQFAAFLDKVLHHSVKQAAAFERLFAVMPSLEIQYRSLAEAVNATKHKLPVKDVLLPEPGSEDEIIELLVRANGALLQYFNDFSESISKKNVTDQALISYLDFVHDAVSSYERGRTLVDEAQDLLLSEASLQLSQVHL